MNAKEESKRIANRNSNGSNVRSSSSNNHIQQSKAPRHSSKKVDSNVVNKEAERSLISESSDVSDATLRKRKSANRIRELGLKSVTVNLNASAYKQLVDMYSAVGFEMINRGNNEGQLNANDVGALLAYILQSAKSGDYNRSDEVKIFLLKVKRMIGYRMKEHQDSDYDIAQFLNDNKIKRPEYLRLPKIQGQNKGRWVEEHISPLRTCRSIKMAKAAFPKIERYIASADEI